MSVIQLDPHRSRLSAVKHVVRRSVQVAAGILVVVVPFGYAITPVHHSVAMAAGAGFAVGVGLNLRMGERGGRPAGILIGSAVGIIIAAGFFSRDREGRRHVRPLVLLIVAILAEMGTAAGVGALEGTDLETTLVLLPTMLVVLPGVAFLSARAAAAWLRPRLQVYLQLAEYLRVMWIPIGGFAAGYLAIILVFAGFCGMLERFRPGAFAGAADAGIGDWIAFSFFSALAQDYTGITPVSVAAAMLVGARLVLSVGWALVVFAAVMSAIQPQLDRIARRNASTDAD